MDYIFTFLGEFGYEMFNWQGVIRKWKTLHKKSTDRIIICGRKGLQSVYEYADEYIDISNLESYKKSTAGIYIAVMEPGMGYDQEGCTELNRKCVNDIKQEVRSFVESKISLQEPKWIFSSDPQIIDQLKFGKVGHGYEGHGIYNCHHNKLDLNNNEFVTIQVQNNSKKDIEKKLGFNLEEDYILVQSGHRDSFMTTKSKQKINHQEIINKLAEHFKIIYLNFDTGRTGDSNSTKQLDNILQYKCDGFDEQGCLINYAKHCVFFTEGDFRSHLYVPPFLGKDVVIIAPFEIYTLPSAPIDFWNKNVFEANMLPVIYEDLDINKLVEYLG